jgi:hypothetical protein
MKVTFQVRIFLLFFFLLKFLCMYTPTQNESFTKGHTLLNITVELLILLLRTQELPEFKSRHSDSDPKLFRSSPQYLQANSSILSHYAIIASFHIRHHRVWGTDTFGEQTYRNVGWPSTGYSGIIPHKTELFITTAVRTWYPTNHKERHTHFGAVVKFSARGAVSKSMQRYATAARTRR